MCILPLGAMIVRKKESWRALARFGALLSQGIRAPDKHFVTTLKNASRVCGTEVKILLRCLIQ
jgi:hypothetical protein